MVHDAGPTSESDVWQWNMVEKVGNRCPLTVASCCSHRCGHPYPVCHDCIWYIMSISGMLFPYLVCYSHHGWSVQPLVALNLISLKKI